MASVPFLVVWSFPRLYSMDAFCQGKKRSSVKNKIMDYNYSLQKILNTNLNQKVLSVSLKCNYPKNCPKNATVQKLKKPFQFILLY